jgi:hypothetical protein
MFVFGLKSSGHTVGNKSAVFMQIVQVGLGGRHRSGLCVLYRFLRSLQGPSGRRRR